MTPDLGSKAGRMLNKYCMSFEKNAALTCVPFFWVAAKDLKFKLPII